MTKTVKNINKKIKNGSVKVVTADDMTRLVKQIGAQAAAEEVDVVTTGTFGAMCSSGVWMNFGHSDPPIKMTKVWINDVEAYTGVAAVDAYLGATQPSESSGFKYGGAHVIEDLLKGKPVVLRAVSYGTDCYPRKNIITQITRDDLNQALMSNPRNAYQRYPAATNSSKKMLYTYMGKLLPGLGNVTFSGAGEISPLMNDPDFETIGLGTRIFLGGSQGYVVGNGTQHNPEDKFATLMVQGDLKKMSTEFLRAATFTGYGCTLYVGIGIPIPVLNEGIAKKTGISDADIFTQVLDYSVESRNRPSLKTLSYAELKTGQIDLNGKRVKTSPLSSYPMAKNIAETLKNWIESGNFLLTEPVEKLSGLGWSNPLNQTKPNIKPSINQPPSLSENHPIWRDEKRCIHCGFCLSICPEDVFIRKETGNIHMESQSCIECGLCSDACPVNAIYAYRNKK